MVDSADVLGKRQKGLFKIRQMYVVALRKNRPGKHFTILGAIIFLILILNSYHQIV